MFPNELSYPSPPRQSRDWFRDEPVIKLSQGAPALGLLLESLWRDVYTTEVARQDNSRLSAAEADWGTTWGSPPEKEAGPGESRVERGRETCSGQYWVSTWIQLCLKPATSRLLSYVNSFPFLNDFEFLDTHNKKNRG